MYMKTTGNIRKKSSLIISEEIMYLIIVGIVLITFLLISIKSTESLF